jgi:hypothetical protein
MERKWRGTESNLSTLLGSMWRRSEKRVKKEGAM